MRVEAVSNAFVLDRVKTPIGALLIVCDDDGHLRAAEFHDHEDRMHRSLRLSTAAQAGYRLHKARAPAPLRDRIEAYFAGELDAIDSIEIATGGTPFQRKVWRALRKITAGKTMTYGALAQRIGADKAIRAVGAANGANPVSVVVPCHRLIGANGSLIRYGGGIERKRWLLQHEGAALKDTGAQLPGL
jgi:methylated-DNA-[protein]-cysteine S-methyltransferase